MSKNDELLQPPPLTYLYFSLSVFFLPWCYFLMYRHVPVYWPSVLAITGSILTFAVLAGYVLYRLPWIFQFVLSVVLLLLSLSFTPFGQSFMTGMYSFLFLLVMILILRKDFFRVMTWVCFTFIIATIIFPLSIKPVYKNDLSEMDYTPRSDLPPIIHIIFDEYGGTEGLPDKYPETVALKKEIKDLYVNAGFRLFGNAYSHYSLTRMSIPNFLNFDASLDPQAHLYERKHINESRYFSALVKQGYKIRIYENGYLDYCNSQKEGIVLCRTYPVFDISQLSKFNVGFKKKLMILSHSVLSSSTIYRKLIHEFNTPVRQMAEKYHIQIPPIKASNTYLGSNILDTLLYDITTNKAGTANGTVFFLHILFPHRPFVLNKQCIPHITHSAFDTMHLPTDIISPALHAHGYADYVGQVRCLNSQLVTFINQLKEKGIFDKAIIVMQGDHGCRISRHGPYQANYNAFTVDDFKDSAKALFAVKAPFYKKGYDTREASLNYLLAEVTSKVTGTRYLTDREPTSMYFTLGLEDYDDPLTPWYVH